MRSSEARNVFAVTRCGLAESQGVLEFSRFDFALDLDFTGST